MKTPGWSAVKRIVRALAGLDVLVVLSRIGGELLAASESPAVRVRHGFVRGTWDRLNPYPLGTAATLQGGWQLKVNSALINADSEVEAVIDPDSGLPANPAPPAGAQYTLVNVSMTYQGGGSYSLPGYLLGVQAEGAGNAGYNVDGCQPPPLDLDSDFTPVFSGQTVTGNLCFEIASNDAASLLLQGRGTAGLPAWFALH